MESVLVVALLHENTLISRKESVNLATMIVNLVSDQVPINVYHVESVKINY
jgi:hypothetical protein